MLTRRHRFHGHTSLNYVYRRGMTVRGPHMAARVVRNPQCQDYRLAVIVSRKVHKAAVKRNRVRRRIYEVVRTGPEIVEPHDIVITVYSEQTIDLEPAALGEQVRHLLQRAGVYTRPAARSNT